ncbi:MAG: Regulatory P domain of the subtilisin-like proprotein convertase/Serine protease, subtilisin family [Verrucomicrobia bacterium]|nr:MAG: Regulatory P domain of the subtilisin-like proprotein convertase/Serine protease, subtilisin family [Verrucomicrobiota bacterium]
MFKVKAVPAMRAPRPSLLFLVLLAVTSSGLAQVVVGGKMFERAPAESGPGGAWVFYERGAPRNEASRRWLSRQVLVELQPAAGAAALDAVRAVPGVVRATQQGRYLVAEFGGPAEAVLTGSADIRKLAGVRAAEPMLARQWARFWVPNDPLFGYDAGNAGYQWHLRNTGQNQGKANTDVNVLTAWDNYKGTGVCIGIVDDGLALNHPDLAANADPAKSYDFNDADADPTPGDGDYHGTACAGVAAGRGNNGIGGTGSAPEAQLAGLRLIAAPTTDAQDAEAISFQPNGIAIKSNSWGPFDTARGAEGPGPLALAAIRNGAATGRGGKGTIFLWAAGNGNSAGDDSNYDGWANLPEVMAVSAINDVGRPAFYSEPGANILICAPSNGGNQGITTTDLVGAEGYNEDGGLVEYPDFADTSYTNTFGGTSSATPTVAGVVALMLQANPNLTYRDVQEILVRTAVQNDEFNSGWSVNAAGFHFHHRYGAVLVDAAACSLASTWTNLAALQLRNVSQTNLGLAIPDADETGLTRILTVPAADNLRIEHVTVKVKATHPYVGNLEWCLTSPSGVKSTLARDRFNDNTANLDWTFLTTHFWGEQSQGNWKLEVFDRTVDHTGTLDEVVLTFHGTSANASLAVPVITSNWLIVGREQWEMEHQITASGSPTAYDAARFYAPGLPAGLSLNSTTGLITGTPLETGPFQGYQAAMNGAGWGWNPSSYFYILAGEPTLSAAVEQPDTLKIIPFGYGDPVRQTAISKDGADAIETAVVKNEEYSGIEFTVNGPAKLDFQWKVSSEKNGDYLVLTVDGYVRDYITGEKDWTAASTYVGSGPHNVDIYYLKDPGVATGQDKGWIDQIEITPTAVVPEIRTGVIQAYQGVYLRQSVEATHAPSAFSATGLPPGLSLHASTGLIYGTVNVVGSYPVTLQATNSAGTAAKQITVEVGTVALGLADAIDALQQVIATSGDVSWAPQAVYTTDGKDAARTGEIANEGRSEMTTQVIGPCKVVFYWGVSSETGYDFLRFYLDDAEKKSISGETGWRREGFLVPSGTHTLRWSYQKDAYTAAGLDAGFVDRFAIYQDGDGDGVYEDLESWFGTSDQAPTLVPQVTVQRSGNNTNLQFPSVAGNEYWIEYSENLVTWTRIPGTIIATGPSTTWIDRNATNKPRRYYRVLLP